MTEVHWRIIANLGFKFPRIAAAVLLTVLLAGGSSRAMLASARLSCLSLPQDLILAHHCDTAMHAVQRLILHCCGSSVRLSVRHTLVLC